MTELMTNVFVSRNVDNVFVSIERTKLSACSSKNTIVSVFTKNR